MQDTHEHGHGNGHGHGHGHGHPEHTDPAFWEAMADRLETEAELRTPLYGQAVDWLHSVLGEDRASAPSARIVDVGSGPGVVASLFAERFPRAEVVAADQASGLLERADARAARLGLEHRLSTLAVDLPDDFGKLGTADLIWSSNAVHHFGDQQQALDTLAAHLAPGGVLAVAERGLPERFLPRDIGIGRPGLHARLDAALEESFGRMREGLPGSVRTVEDWPAMLARAGLVPSGSRTFLLDRPAPLGPVERGYIRDQLARVREQAGDVLDADDAAALDVLLDDASEEGIHRRPDAFLLSATTVHTARADAG